MGYFLCLLLILVPRGATRSTIILKMRRVGRFNFHKVQVVPKPFTCPRGKCLLVECRPLDDEIVRALLLPTFGYETCAFKI